MREGHQGFTLIEVIVAIVLLGVGVAALLLALAQGARTFRLTSRWAKEERQATGILMQKLNEWQQLRSDTARRDALLQRGSDGLLGPWEWNAEPEHRIVGRPVDLYRVRLVWGSSGKQQEVETHAVLRIVS